MSRPDKATRQVEREEREWTRRSKVLKIKVENGVVTTKQGSGPFVGAKASIVTEGQLTSRVSLTRVVGLGIFALGAKKKVDKRELYLTIEGEGFQFVLPVHPTLSPIAHQWVGQFNTRALAAASQ